MLNKYWSGSIQLHVVAELSSLQIRSLWTYWRLFCFIGICFARGKEFLATDSKVKNSRHIQYSVISGISRRNEGSLSQYHRHSQLCKKIKNANVNVEHNFYANRMCLTVFLSLLKRRPATMLTNWSLFSSAWKVKFQGQVLSTRTPRICDLKSVARIPGE